jgi:hypothetical protein
MDERFVPRIQDHIISAPDDTQERYEVPVRTALTRADEREIIAPRRTPLEPKSLLIP